jgi:NAD(P)-dependent dehydrogenase (short-subunit alcohol dehydrogenase family)
MNGPGKKIAIVTGASGGLGKEFVKLLLREENIDEIWAIAKNEEKLIRLQTDCGEKIKIFPTDLSNIKAIEDFSFYLKEHDPDILFLINNAGFAKFCSYNDLSIEESVNMIDLNCSAVVAMGLVCIPYIKAGGHILNIASAAAFVSKYIQFDKSLCKKLFPGFEYRTQRKSHYRHRSLSRMDKHSLIGKSTNRSPESNPVLRRHGNSRQSRSQSPERC